MVHRCQRPGSPLAFWVIVTEDFTELSEPFFLDIGEPRGRLAGGDVNTRVDASSTHE